ncbi:low molecular weight protein-tyrosine-phosphatase [Chryseolinea sp. T2]|uniref:low molecular weight protein-tyrosine-phosphatase n=1 Tax=Chryseolinea sp. T2 TaxID=3129255 RepID=UPI003077F4BC
MVKVVFVCLGNICRSPMAEAIFRHLIKEQGLADVVEIDSCGTANYHVGDDADPRTIQAVRSKGIAIDHCVRQLVAADLDEYDYVLAMDRSNYQNIKRLANAQNRSRVIMMRDFDPGHAGEEVPDPYYGNQKHFEDVYEILFRSLSAFVEFLVKTESKRLG